MTVEKIIPCVCTTHVPIPIVNSDYGMPILMPINAGNHKQYWSVVCPMCGRGGFGITEEKSAYKALKKWNEIQETCYDMVGRKIEYEKEWNENDSDAGYEENRWSDAIRPVRFIEDMSKSSMN